MPDEKPMDGPHQPQESPTPPATSLAEALSRYEIQLPDEQVARLEQYCQLLWQWNEQFNLTRHTDYDKFASRDVVDSIQLAELLEPNEKVLDVGTGGGVPGLILAVLRPDVKVAVCESVGKKAAAVEAMVAELDLPVMVLHGRAEDILENFHFDTLVARAVGPMWKMCKWFQGRWNSIGRLLAVKGPRWVDERGEARHRGYMSGLALRKVAAYHMRGTESESVILCLWPKQREPQLP